MNKELQQAKKEYKQIEIPTEFNDIVSQTIQKNQRKRTYQKKSLQLLSGVAILFIALLNVSPAFAKHIAEIPILGNIADIFRVVRIQETSEQSVTDVSIPTLSGLGDTEFQIKINRIIQDRVTYRVNLAKENAEEFMSGYSSAEDTTNGIKAEVFGDFEIHHANKSMLSFSVYLFESAGSSYISRDFYTIDLINNKQLQLSDMFRTDVDYISVINAEIARQIADREKKDGNLYFHDEEFPGVFNTISKNQSFYLDSKGNIVIYFGKYEIAPGYMGEQSFTLPRTLVKSLLNEE